MVGSLFSGIGGFDLGLERAGMEVRWQVERDEWCRNVLAKHWPDVKRYGDIHDLTGDELEPVDLICGGFPCQPVSVAGQQKGTDDDRWLWPEFKRLVGLLRPRYVLVENVPGLLTANGGHAFGEVIGDLADLGYDCEWTVLSAADVGAPHLRKRVWIVADADRARRPRNQNDDGARVKQSDAPRRSRGDFGLRQTSSPTTPEIVAHAQRTGEPTHGSVHQRDQGEPAGNAPAPVSAGTEVAHAENTQSGGAYVADADRTGLEGRELLSQRASERTVGTGGVADANGRGREKCWPSEQSHQSRARGDQSNGCGPDGRFFDAEIGCQWEPEPDVGRVAHGIPKRVDRLRGLGNAVVPQCAEALGHMIMARERLTCE